MTKCNNDTNAARALDMRKLAMIDKHARTQLLRRGCELEHAVIHQRSDSNSRRLCIARCCYSRWINGQFYYICSWALIRCKIFSAAHYGYALLQECAFLIVTGGTKHATMRSGYNAVQVQRPITDEVSDELVALEDCEQDILLEDNEDLKTMLVNNKRTAVVAGRFWSDSQLELEPWDATSVRQLIRDNLSIPRVTKEMMLVYPDNWDALVDEYEAQSCRRARVPADTIATQRR